MSFRYSTMLQHYLVKYYFYNRYESILKVVMKNNLILIVSLSIVSEVLFIRHFQTVGWKERPTAQKCFN